MKSIYSRQYKKFISLLVHTRKSASITQQELAEQLGKPQSYVSKYELGERRIDVVEFIRICAALKAQPQSILRAIQKED